MSRKPLSRREFLRLSAAAAGVGVLAACAPAGAPGEAPAGEAAQGEAAAPPAGEKVQIRFATFDWFAYVPGVSWDQFIQNEAFPAYQEEHPNVELLYEPLGDGWETKTLTQMAAGTAPDVISAWPPTNATWAEKGQLLDLQPYVDLDWPDADTMFLKAAWEQTWDPVTQIRMGVVTDIDVTSLYYSKPPFEEAGVGLPVLEWTLDDYVNAATKLTVRDASGNITRWGAQLRPSIWDGWFYYIQSFGGDVRDDDTLMICQLDSDEAQQALEWIRTNMWDVNCFGQNNQINATGIPNTWTGVLPAGIVAMAERSADQFFALADSLPEGSWDIAHIPAGPKDRACMGALDIYCVYKGVLDRGTDKEVWEFTKWLGASEFFQGSMAAKAGRIPGLLSEAEKWPQTLRTIDSRLEPVALEVVIDQINTGEARAVQTFRYQSVAAELIDPAMQAILVEGVAPVSSLIEVAGAVNDAQQEALKREQGG